MSVYLPKDIKDVVKKRVWDKADELGWDKLSALDRSSWYERWSKDKEIGGVLARFVDSRKVRVYIKDTLLKSYLRSRLEDDVGTALLAVGFNQQEVVIKKRFDKPHGCMLIDGKIICWGNSRDWKLVVISVFERAYRTDQGVPFAAVLMEEGKTTDAGSREMIQCAGEKLGVRRVSWIE